MVKKIAVFALLGTICIMPAISLAAVDEMTQVGAPAKLGGTVPVIRLASNEIAPIQSRDRKVVAKIAASDDSSTAPSNIPPQAWLVLTALFCFVMRSSRRVV